ncbi:MAG: tRNA lysidine(34) synthetase TilS [Propioniciclava sp.]
MARRALGPASLAVVGALDALPAAPWLVACSGGTDSLALAWAARLVGQRRGTPVRAVVVDHGLQDGSDRIAAAVSDALGLLDIAAVVHPVAVTVDGRGLEAAARDARHAALVEALNPEETLLLGHTLDDQAETVLLGLARGAGVRALAGMASQRGRLRRPLLGLRRTVTAAACAEQGLQPWQDPHNSDPAFARVRVRTQVLPLLETELGPGIAEALARTATLARADADALDALAGVPADEPGCSYLAGLDPALRSRQLRDWLRERGSRDVTSGHITAVDRLITGWRGQAGVDVPGGRVLRVDGRLRWQPRSR